MDLLIFLELQTPRTDYIFNHIFVDLFGLDVQYTTDKNIYLKSRLPKIQYGFKSICENNCLFFNSVNLLFENDIRKQDLQVSYFKKIKVFFDCESKDSSLPFDVFAASFYMISRYEEYLIYNKDKLGRFPAELSLAFKHSILDVPIVDHWILILKKIITNKFPELIFKDHKFKFINTIDVDSAYSYLDKGFCRTILSCFKDIFFFDFYNLRLRFEVIFFGKKDPYDTFNKILTLHKQYKLESIFFFLLSNYTYYDRNTNFMTKRFNNLINKIYNLCNVGIHGSFLSSTNYKKLKSEINRLSKLTKSQVVYNRQHYINLRLPETYKNLIKNGILHDFTMGYNSHPGFRAGTCFCFNFFDLDLNRSTNLKVHSFAIMDVTLKDYLLLNPDDALSLIKKIIKSVSEVNGKFISIFHNESLDYSGRWSGWEGVYEDMINFVKSEEG
ncbi:MAG: hypothetical protein CMP65_00515 [Flavobacteriales bacterium]|nr:hypothetical protein [Flavobacteriales bacterium]|tara:strand:- start:8755 stop:10080 length:1326 start_codon:yes stop_codon:yes gene_type:complete